MSDTLSDGHVTWAQDFTGLAISPPGQSADPNAGGQSVDPNAGGQSVDPNAGGQSIDPNSGGQSVDPNAGGQSVDPNAGDQSVDPNANDAALPDGVLAAMAGPGGGGRGKGDPPAGDLDEGEGRNRDGTIRRKPGDHGRFRGRDQKRQDDADFDEVCDEMGLDKDQRRRLHEAVSGRNLGKDGIRAEAENLFPKKQPEKKADPEPDPAKDPVPQPKPETDPASSGPSESTLKKVTAVIIVLGLSIDLVFTVAAAVADPEPATKLLLVGLTVVEVTALAAALGFKPPSQPSGA